MTSHEAYAQIRQALKQELHRHRGHIREIEAGLSRSEGYLSKVCRGDISMPLEVLLKSLELLEAEPSGFFGRALAARPDPADLLRDAAEAARGDRAADDLLTAARNAASALDACDSSPAGGLDLSNDQALLPQPTEAETALVRQLVECSLPESRRRLRATKKYRTVGFTRACLDHLTAKRAQDPATVAKLAAALGADLVPALEISPGLRLALIGRAAVEYASARRMLQDQAGAAAVVRPLLPLARQHGLRRLCGELWRLGARILLHRGQARHALELFDQAVLCYADFGLSLDLASLHLDRAIVHEQIGDLAVAERSLEVALRELDHLEALGLATVDAMRLSRISAHSLAAELASQKGETETALHHARSAADNLGETSGVRWAQAQWKIAEMSMAADIYSEQVEGTLDAARDEFARLGDSNAILVVLDLTRCKLKRGKVSEALEDARGMAAFLSQHRGEPVLDAALTHFVRTVLEGELTLSFVVSFRQSLMKAIAVGGSG